MKPMGRSIPDLTSWRCLCGEDCRGSQDDEYMKTAACAKHFAVHSGPEGVRHEFDAKASKKDMYETYLPAFEACVEAGVEAVMGAYNEQTAALLRKPDADS